MTRAHLFAVLVPTAMVLAAGCSSSSGVDGGTDASRPADAGSVDAGRVDAGTIDAGADNHSFTTAAPITINATPTSATLASAMGTDYYKLSANAGDRLELATKTSAATGAVDAVDTVITVFNTVPTRLAQDDDAWPRFNTDSALLFDVPATGTYYVTVEDCFTAFGAGSCAPLSGITDLHYTLEVFETAKSTAPEANAGMTQDGTTGKAVTVPYAVPPDATGMDYAYYTIDGSFQSATDTQVFSFTPPANTTVIAETGVRADFWAQPIGTMNGDGSTANVKMWITDSSGSTVLAEVNQNNYLDGDNPTNGPIDLSVPITLGTQYYLFVQNTDPTYTPVTDYYFVIHFEGTWHYGTPEAEGPTAQGVNDTPATAEVLTTPMGAPAGSYYVDGFISSTGAMGDVDWYEVDPPSGSSQVSLFCSAERAGSGLRNLTIGLYTLDSSNTPTAIPSASGVEVDNADLALDPGTFPAGATRIALEVSATTQDATVTGTYYYCGVNYK